LCFRAARQSVQDAQAPDLLALAPDRRAADQLAEALLAAGLADDVIGLSQGRRLEGRRGDDPCWRGICRDAICLQPLQKSRQAVRTPGYISPTASS